MVPDNAEPKDLEPEPEGFWSKTHDEVKEWLKEYGEE